MRASGSAGLLRVGYQQAAVLGQWTVELEHRLPRAYVLRARILSEHSFWITQRPIDVVLRLAGVDWIWRDIGMERDADGRVVVRLTERPIVEASASTA